METCAQRGCPAPFGTAQCHCAACHQTFSGSSAFDKHQTLADGRVACHEPQQRGLVAYERTGRIVWGWPESSGWVSARRAGVAQGA